MVVHRDVTSPRESSPRARVRKCDVRSIQAKSVHDGDAGHRRDDQRDQCGRGHFTALERDGLRRHLRRDQPFGR